MAQDATQTPAQPADADQPQSQPATAPDTEASPRQLSFVDEQGNATDTPAFLNAPRPVLEGEDDATFWDDLRDSLPPWLDEIIAIALLIFGILSFLALFDPSQAVVALAWADIITGLFGYGSLLVAGGLFLLGVILLLPKAGIKVQFSPLRVLAIEITFLCILAVMHVAFEEKELRALARAGEGGGMIGWGLTAVPHWLLGQGPTVVFFAFLGVISFAVMLGVRWRHITDWFNNTGDKLLDWGDALIDPELMQSNVPLALSPDEQRDILLATRRTAIMRIRPNWANLPPSLRPNPDGETDDDDIDIESHPLFKKGEELKVEVNIVGELTGKKDDEGYPLVRRPDGREKRYFDVNEMREAKKVGRRDKTLPPLDILQDVPLEMPDESEINRTVVLIENTLLEFDIDIDIVDVQVGPTVTRYAVQPYRTKKDGTTERTRLNKIASYVNDLSLSLSAKRLRLEIPVPGTNYMGIEVPNQNPSTVALRSVYESREYYEQSQKADSLLFVPLGRDVSGRAIGIDIGKMPHLLIAGTTGSGKSVSMAAIATALIMNNTPEQVKMVMLDPKMVELSRFNGLPHLLGPVETDTERIIGVLKWCTREMDRRYKLLEEHAVRNIDNFNAKFGQRRRGRDFMPYIVIMIDEIGDLMMSRPEETETAITRLAQMARAVGMHLIIATQRPSVDVITGLIKANFPGRISFAVASGVDSRVILDSVGAEALLGHGDMLYLSPDAGAPRRIQGCFVSDEEVRDIVQHWLDWRDEQIESGKLERRRIGPWEQGLTRREFLAQTDPMLEEVIEFVVDTQEASASLIQRRMGLGYPRAARLMDLLEELGVVGEAVGGGRARRVVIPRGEDPFKRIIENQVAEKRRKARAADAEPTTDDE